MTIALRFLTVSFCIIGTAALAAEPTKTFECKGPFGRDATHAKLASTYGAANILTEYDGELDADVTVLFPKNPERRLTIKWKDAKARRNPEYITIAGRSWSVAGVAIGISLIELERLNGGPFKLNYFEGDYGGAITDWLMGHFQVPLPGGCVLGAFVAIDERLSEAESKALDDEVTSDRSLLSSGVGLRAAKPVVSKMAVSFK